MIELLELNYKVTPINIRECVSSHIDTIQSHLDEIGKQKLYVLATCHRITFVAWDTNVKEVIELLNRYTAQLKYSEIYHLKGQSAVKHLFQVASGLHSKTLGEHEVLGQIRNSYSKQKHLCAELHELMKRTIHVGKRVKTETYIGRHVTSLASVTMEAITAHFPMIDTLRVLVIGTGDMARLILKRLDHSDFQLVTIASKDVRRAKSLLSHPAQEAVQVEAALLQIQNYDVIIGATKVSSPVLSKSHFYKNECKKLLIDLGMPRNFDGGLGFYDNITLCDLENIQASIDHHQKQRVKEITDVYKIISEEAHQFFKWLDFRAYIPKIVTLKTQLKHQEDRVVEVVNSFSDNKTQTALRYKISGLVQSHFSLVISVYRSGIQDQQLIARYQNEILQDLESKLKDLLGKVLLPDKNQLVS